MIWIIAAGGAALLILLAVLFLNNPVRRAATLSRLALRACQSRDWAAAARFYRESHEAAGKLGEPLKSRIEAQLEIQWAGVLCRQGKMREAEELFQRGLAKASVGSLREYEVVQQGHLSWGDLCADEGRHTEAEEHYRKALESDERCENAAGTIGDLQRLGDSLIRQERRAEAEEVIERAIALETRTTTEQMEREKRNPTGCRFIPLSVPDLHFCRGEYEEARQLYGRNVEFWEKQVTRPGNVDVGHLQMRLAASKARTGHQAEAIEMYARAEATFQREWCEGHPKAIAAREAKVALIRDAAQVGG
jgi:tetratricopeptide (TPR) repeat protein